MSKEGAPAPDRGYSAMKVAQKVIFQAIDEPGKTNDGRAFVSGIIQLTKDGRSFKQPFTAYDEQTTNGKNIVAATKILETFKVGDVAYVKGVFQNDMVKSGDDLVPKTSEKGHRLRRLVVKFADTQAEHDAFVSDRKTKSNAKNGEAR